MLFAATFASLFDLARQTHFPPPHHRAQVSPATIATSATQRHLPSSHRHHQQIVRFTAREGIAGPASHLDTRRCQIPREDPVPRANDTMSASKTGLPARPLHDQAGTKRSRPCDACRRRKSKCVTEEGNSMCVLCRFHNQACKYEEAPQPRKRSAVRGGTADSQPPSKRGRTIHIRPGTGVEEYDTLPGPSLLKRTLGLQNSHHSEYVGPNAIPDVYGGQRLDRYDEQGDDHSKPEAEYIRFVHPSAAFRIIPDVRTAGYDQERSDIDEIERTAAGHGPELVQLYFRIVHPSFPILHKEVFVEKYGRSFREFAPPLLAAVYLLASSYWAYSEALAKVRRINTDALQTLAFNALQNTMRRPKLSTIQAGLLLSQHQKAFMGPVPNEQRDRLTVQLVNLAHGLGIHLDSSQWDIPDWEIGLRRRIGWGLYVQDKFSALLESRPSLISNEEWDVESLSEDDFPETTEDDTEGSSEVGRGRLVYTHMADLSAILADILSSLFSARGCRAIDSSMNRLASSLEQIKPLQIKLKEWSLTLPESLKMDSAASMKLSSVGYLRLAYLTIEVCIHRVLIRALATTDYPDPTMVQVVRLAAKERLSNATDFVQRLQAQHLLSFWYFPSAKCCALIYAFGQALQDTAESEHERAQYATKLKEFKWTLKVNSEAGATFMQQALAFISQPVRVSSLPVDNSSTTTSPVSMPFSAQSTEAPPAQQWLPHPTADGSMPYGAFSPNYGLDHIGFPDPNAMFAHLPTDLQGSWPPGMS
ncbi:hypothetical protein DOTSEDRAFT_69828 [Dothistroma septosporum NZE10]|uniref:Zn(2)-C6 fungal-type domain-containing protein n=1 Tax=Dothistroma septosporum (strain NZE10 / CBS 128990) TaxID=675120 RepID=N1PYG9_DOTSN|nr:hypothetical protein DOTSEDRAFT_69828 [Dothistroma septosporum NZE10]